MPTFRHGKTITILGDAADLSAYFNSVSVGNEVETAETTTFNSSARSYVVGWKTGSISFEGLFDGSTDAVDEILTTALSSDGISFTVATEGTTVGRRAIVLRSKQTKYDVTSPLGDVVSTSAEATSDGGLDYGVLLAGREALTGSFTGGAVDNSVSSTNGYAAHMHATANTRNGSTTVKVQHSADNSTWVDLITFTSVPTATTASQRVVGTGTVQRYLRAIATPGGSTGTITVTVALARR